MTPARNHVALTEIGLAVLASLSACAEAPVQAPTPRTEVETYEENLDLPERGIPAPQDS